MVAGEEARKMLRIHFKSVTGDLKKKKKGLPRGASGFSDLVFQCSWCGFDPHEGVKIPHALMPIK